MDNNGPIILIGLIALVLLVCLMSLVIGPEMGCYVIGSEVNGNNTVEYMSIGNCY